MNELYPHPWLTTYRQYSSCLIEINLIPDCAALHPWFSLTPSLIGLHTISDWATTQSELSYKYIPFLIGLHTISDWATTQSNLSCMYNCTSHSAYYILSQIELQPNQNWATCTHCTSHCWLGYILSLIELQPNQNWATCTRISHPWLGCILSLIELQPNQNWATCTSHSWLGYILSLIELQPNQNWSTCSIVQCTSHSACCAISDWATTQ